MKRNDEYRAAVKAILEEYSDLSQRDIAYRLDIPVGSISRIIRSLHTEPANDTPAAPPSTAPKRHIVIPDCQVKDGVDLAYLSWVGQYIADQRPDRLIQIGDFADMPSLSSYDKGKKSFEGRRYKKDVQVTRDSMHLLMSPIWAAQHKSPWAMTQDLVIGNHEQRIIRVIEDDARLDGTIGMDDLGYEGFGWNVHPYLQPVNLDGVNYAHFFTSGVMGRPVSSARALIAKKHESCVMGHVQMHDVATAYRVDGRPIIGLFVGACYLHNEDYLGPQGNHYWRGIWVLNEVLDGDFQLMQVSLDYLRRKYA